MHRNLFLAIFLCLFAAPAQAVVVTLAGDYGATEHTRSVLQHIGALKPEIHIALGDLSYAQLPESEWCAMVKEQVHSPVLLVPGNHESDGHEGEITKFSACLPYAYHSPLHGEYPAQYYIDVPAEKPLARMIMISPNLHFSDGRQIEYVGNNPNMQWFVQSIRDARAHHIPWVIVNMHKVCLSTETKSCEIGQELMQTLIAEKVDIVMAGHVHAYERTHQLACATANLFKPECVVPAAPGTSYTQGRGSVFVTVGTGGIPLRRVSSKDSEHGYFVTTLGKDEGKHYGIAKLDITSNTLTHEFIEAATGTPLDSFTVHKTQ